MNSTSSFLSTPLRVSLSYRSTIFRIVAGCFFLCSMPVRPVAANDEEQLKVVRDGYVQAITSIRNVWCRYEVRREFSDRMGETDAPKVRIWEWAAEGEKYHCSSIPAETDAGTHYSPYWVSTDGKQFWVLEYTDNDEIFFAAKKQLRDGTWQMRDRVTPGRFLGLYFSVGDLNTRSLTLQSILETVPLTLGGKQTIDGHECWRVDFDYPGAKAVNEIPMTVFFDPAANYLPRRLIQHSTSGGAPTIRTVVKFAIVKDGKGNRIYVPWEMRDEHPLCVSRVKVQQVKLNEKLPATLYRPRIPPGVEVYDLDKDRDLKALRRKQSEAGSRRREGLNSETAAKNSRSGKTSAATSLNSGEPVVDARPSFVNYAIIVLVTGGLVMLSVVTYSYRIRKK